MRAWPTKPFGVSAVTITDGRSVHATHIRPYADEPTTLTAIYKLMAAADLEVNGLLHEIYLTDVATTEHAKLRTILCQPVRPR